MFRIGIVAGEASGDYLGATLIEAIRKKIPDVVVEGIGGPQMEHAGCRIIYPMERLAVMGFAEVMGRIVEILKIRNSLCDYFIRQPPDVFIGIDAPDFNLGLELKLRNHKIKTVHYVSPQVWAWREYRINKISRAVDLMLPLFPFEKNYYEKHSIPVTYVGHPLAHKIPLHPDKAAARRRLGLPEEKKIIAIMPGSRRMELNRLLKPFLLAANRCFKQRSDLHFASSLLHENAIAQMQRSVKSLGIEPLPLSIYCRRSHDVLEAADIVLLASGTISLETMLYKRPMVIAYRASWFSYLLARMLVKVNYVGLPNILAGEGVVPECLQNECRPERLEAEIMNWLNNPESVARLEQRFIALHKSLKLDSGEVAAQAVLGLSGA